jgi:hypothetical protein
MAITDAQIELLKKICPGLREIDAGALIRAAESGGVSEGAGIDITAGVISADVDDTTVSVGGSGIQVKAKGVDTAQLADDAVETGQVADLAITLGKLAAAVQSAIVSNAVAALAAAQKIIRGQITLAGANPTTVQIASSPNNATLLGTTGPSYLLTVNNTFIVNPNAVGNQTWTVAGTAGTSTGTTGCSEDMSAAADNKLKVAVDGGAAQVATFDWTAGGGCNTGAKIAAQMQTVIRALGGDYAAVTVAFSTDHYVVTSGNKGTASVVVITAAADHNCTEELKLGVADGGSEAAGTGDVPILARATAAQCAAKIAALHASLANTAAEGNHIRLNATGSGGSSSLVVGNGTENTVLGFTNTQADYGDVGLAAGHAMADANYTVVVTPLTNDPAAVDVISVYNKAAGSFDIYAETAVAIPVEIIVIGAIAS